MSKTPHASRNQIEDYINITEQLCTFIHGSVIVDCIISGKVAYFVSQSVLFNKLQDNLSLICISMRSTKAFHSQQHSDQMSCSTNPMAHHIKEYTVVW